MASTKRLPRLISRRYILDRFWLRAFRDCGFYGPRAVAAADEATRAYELTLPLHDSTPNP